MNSVGLYALPPLLVALLAGRLLFSKSANQLRSYKYAEIEGLRGFLAFFVFLHHAFVWRQGMASHSWSEPSISLFAHLGRTSVALFFMITAFLFTSRLLDSERPLQWRRFAFSRVMRLMPAYVIVVALICGVVAIESGFELRESVAAVSAETIRWLSLGILGMPDINAVPQTGRIVAWVVWSLPYEVFFYIALPLGAFLLGLRVSKALVFSVALVLALLWTRGVYEPRYFMAFLPGVAAAFVVKHDSIRQFCSGAFASIIATVAIIAAVTISPTVFKFSSGASLASFILVALFFVLVACGTSLFGVLKARSSNVLGQISYSVYLLHGIVLYLVIRVVLGEGIVASFSDLEYWALVTLAAPVVVGMAWLSFRYVEAPGMRLAEVARRRAPQSIPADPERVSA